MLLFQGNLQFTSDGEHVMLVGEDMLKHISELTSTEPENTRKALLYRTVATGGGEVIEKGHSEQEASYGRDAFAKVLNKVKLFFVPRPVSHYSYYASTLKEVMRKLSLSFIF